MSKSTMAQPLAASTSPRFALAGMRYNIRPCPIVPVRMVSSLLRPRFTRCPFSCSSSSSSSNSISARSSKPLASRHGALNIVRLSSSSSRAVSLGSVSKKRDAYLFEVMWEDNDKPQTFQTEQSMMARYNHLLKESRLMATLSARKRFERPRDKLQRERMERIEYIKWQRKQGAYLPESLESAGGQEQRLEEPFFDVFGLATDGDEYQDTAAAAAAAANAQFVEQRLNYGHYANNPANILDLSQFMNDFDSSSSSSESNIWGGYMDQQVPAGAGVSGVNPPGDYGGYVNPGGYVNQGSLLYPVMAHPDTAAAAAAGVSSSGGLLDMEQFAAAGAAGGGQQQQQQPYMDSDPSITGFMTYQQQQQQQTSNDLAHPEMGAGVVAGGTDWAAWTNQTLSTAAAGPQAAAAASEDSAFTMPPLPPVLPLWQQYDVNQPLLGTSGDVDAQQEQLDKLYQQYEQLLLQQQQQHLQQLQQQPEFATIQQQWQQPETGQQVMASPLAAAAAGGDSDLAPDSQAVISEPMLPEYEPAAEPRAAVQDLQQLLSSAAEPSAAVQDLQQPLSTAAAAVSTGVADVTPAALPSVEVQEPPQVSAAAAAVSVIEQQQPASSSAAMSPAAAAVNAADIEPRSDVAGSRQPSRRQLGSNKPRQQRRQPQQQSAQPRGKQQQQQPAFSAAATATSLQQAQAALAASMEKLQALDALLAARGLAPQQQQQQQQVANDVSASSSSSSVVPQGDRQAYDTGSGSNDRVRQSSGRSRPSNGKRSMQRVGSTAAAAVKTKAVDPKPRDLSAV